MLTTCAVPIESLAIANAHMNLQTACNNFFKQPKIGKAKVKQHRSIHDNYKLKAVTASQKPSGNYYAGILFEHENQVHQNKPQTFLEPDFFMHELYVDSNGNKACYPRYYRKAERKPAREQRKLSLMQKGFENCEKPRVKAAKIQEKVVNQRRDFLHRHLGNIYDSYDCVCMKSPDMKAMLQSPNFGKAACEN